MIETQGAKWRPFHPICWTPGRKPLWTRSDRLTWRDSEWGDPSGMLGHTRTRWGDLTRKVSGEGIWPGTHRFRSVKRSNEWTWRNVIKGLVRPGRKNFDRRRTEGLRNRERFVKWQGVCVERLGKKIKTSTTREKGLKVRGKRYLGLGCR